MTNLNIIFHPYGETLNDTKKHREIFEHLNIFGMEQRLNQEGVFYYRSKRQTKLKDVTALKVAVQMAFPGVETTEPAGLLVNKNGHAVRDAKALIFKLPSNE